MDSLFYMYRQIMKKWSYCMTSMGLLDRPIKSIFFLLSCDLTAASHHNNHIEFNNVISGFNHFKTFSILSSPLGYLT